MSDWQMVVFQIESFAHVWLNVQTMPNHFKETLTITFVNKQHKCTFKDEALRFPRESLNLLSVPYLIYPRN